MALTGLFNGLRPEEFTARVRDFIEPRTPTLGRPLRPPPTCRCSSWSRSCAAATSPSASSPAAAPSSSGRSARSCTAYRPRPWSGTLIDYDFVPTATPTVPDPRLTRAPRLVGDANEGAAEGHPHPDPARPSPDLRGRQLRRRPRDARVGSRRRRSHPGAARRPRRRGARVPPTSAPRRPSPSPSRSPTSAPASAGPSSAWPTTGPRSSSSRRLRHPWAASDDEGGPTHGSSVEAELVALDVLHHQARLVVLVGQQELHAYGAQRLQPRALGLEGGQALLPTSPVPARTSRWTRFLTTLPSGTRWKNSRGPTPVGSTHANHAPCCSGGSEWSWSSHVAKPSGTGGATYPRTSHQKRPTRPGSAQSKVTWNCFTVVIAPP